MGLFVPLDVDYQFDPKIIAAGPIAGECLFIRSLALAKRTLSDGAIDRTQLAALTLGLPGKPASHAAKLVEVGLWSTTDNGWQISAWLKRNSSSASIAANADRKRDAAVKANHERWHVGPQGRPKPDCHLCTDPLRARSEPDSEPDHHRSPNGDPTGIHRVETEQRKSRDRAEPSSSSSPSDTHRTPLRAVDDDDEGSFIAAVIDHIANLRTAKRLNRTGSDIGYRLAVTADLVNHERATIAAQHARWPQMDPDHLARYYEGHPELHPTPGATG